MFARLVRAAGAWIVGLAKGEPAGLAFVDDYGPIGAGPGSGTTES